MKHLDVVRVKLAKEFQLSSLGTINNPKDAVKLAADYFSDCSQEVFGLCCLSAKGEVQNLAIISQGTVTAALVDLRAVMQAVILSNAANFVCIHNHPSGDCTPSRDDIAITERIKVMCKILGYQFLDHIIVGDGKYYSFQEHQELDSIEDLTFDQLLDWCDQQKVAKDEYIDFEL